MATKTPAKGKKASAPKEKEGGKGKRAPKAAAKPAAAEDEDTERGDEDEDEDDDLDLSPKPAAKKPAPAKPAGATATGGEPPAVVPARRLTPEAKAKVNEMVKKGMPLGEALKAAAAWETFVAPVKDEPAKLVQGKSFEGGPRPRRPAAEEDEAPAGIDDEEPAVEAED